MERRAPPRRGGPRRRRGARARSARSRSAPSARGRSGAGRPATSGELRAGARSISTRLSPPAVGRLAALAGQVATRARRSPRGVAPSPSRPARGSTSGSDRRRRPGSRRRASSRSSDSRRLGPSRLRAELRRRTARRTSSTGFAADRLVDARAAPPSNARRPDVAPRSGRRGRGPTSWSRPRATISPACAVGAPPAARSFSRAASRRAAGRALGRAARPRRARQVRGRALVRDVPRTVRSTTPVAHASGSRHVEVSPGGATASARRAVATCSIARRSSSRPDGSNSYDQRRIRSGRSNRSSEAVRDRLAREQDDVGRPVDQARAPRRRPSSRSAARRRSCPDSASVSAMFSVPRSRGADEPDARARAAARRSRGRAPCSPARRASRRPAARPWTSAWASSAWNVVVATRS